MMKCKKTKNISFAFNKTFFWDDILERHAFHSQNTLAKSFCTGSDHPELPRMIRPNSDFQHWVSPDDPVLHRMIWTQTGLTGLGDRSDRSGLELLTCSFWSEKWCYGLLFEELSHLRDQSGYIKVIVSTASTISILVNYFCALTKVVNEPPYILYRIKCLLAKIFKILGTD